MVRTALPPPLLLDVGLPAPVQWSLFQAAVAWVRRRMWRRPRLRPVCWRSVGGCIVCRFGARRQSHYARVCASRARCLGTALSAVHGSISSGTTAQARVAHARPALPPTLTSRQQTTLGARQMTLETSKRDADVERYTIDLEFSQHCLLEISKFEQNATQLLN